MKLLAWHLTRLQTAEAVPPQVMPAAIGAIRARFTELWPHAMLWLGIVLTIAWSTGLAWLLLRFLDVV